MMTYTHYSHAFEEHQKRKATAEIKYPVGSRIELISVGNEDPAPIASGTCGTVHHVDGLGSIHVIWDDGRRLGVVPGIDTFRRIESPDTICG